MGATTSSVSLSWNVPIGGASTYNLYRNGTKVQSGISGTSTTDAGLTPSTSYTYYVTAQKTIGEGSQSNRVVSSTGAVPNAPQSLAVTSTTSSTVSLSWTAPVGGASSYNLYRNGTKVQSGISSTLTTDTGLSASTGYTYYVTGTNSFGEGPQSNQVTGTTSGATGAARIHPGAGFNLDNPFYPGNQQGIVNSTANTITSATGFNRMTVNFTWSNISDPALDGSGKQTFNIFRTNLSDVLTRLRSHTTKKIYLTVKFWQGAFYKTFFGTIQSVSGNTFTTTSAISPTSGWTSCLVGSTFHTVVSTTSTTVTLANAVGAGAGASIELGQQKTSDTSYWPAWVNSKSPAWVKAFFQTNSNARGQLDYDNPDVFTAQLEMVKGMVDAIRDLDTDNRVDILAYGDESTIETNSIGQGTVANYANYNTKFDQLMVAIKNYMPERTLWIPWNYMADGGGTTALDAMVTSVQNMRTNFPQLGWGGGGPDTPLFGVHGTPTAWYTTFLQVITGNVGTLGDIRGQILLIGNTEGPGLGTGSNFATCPTTLTYQTMFNDIMTNALVPASGGRPAHNGLNSSIMHWIIATRFCMQPSDMTAIVAANGGSFGPLPPGNWDTTP